MANVMNLNAEVGANYIGDDTTAPSVTFSNTNAAGLAAGFSKTTISSPTIGLIQFLTSGASLPALQFAGSGFASLSTIKATTGGAAGTFGIRVVSDTGVLGWIPVYPDAAVTAVAI